MAGPGLHIIFDSAKQHSGPSHAPEIDIVAVHGLNFKNTSDHARSTWTDNGQLWLKDFLPARLAKPARVMLFEYNASPAMGAAAIKMDDYTKNFLQWLGIRRKEDPGRPLIFVCHSLGGLVVKEALVEATLDPTYKSIVEATCLLVFFATPHQGGNYATVGDVAARIVRAGLRKPSNDLVKSLESSSNEATRRFEQFRHLNEKFLVISFYEGKSYGTLGLIVDKKSATLNLSGMREKQVAMHADHSSICKFSAAGDPACELVIETIATEVERALKLQPSHLERSPRNMHWCIPRSVNALFIGRTDVLERIERAITRKENDQKQRRFVVTGIGGQGKSELCLRIADQMREVFWGVFWVDVSSESAAAAGFLRISNILGSSAEDIDDTRQLLSNAKDDWLLVLDNADDPNTDYERYFPSGTRGAILITSRIPECSYYNTVGSEQLGSLSPGDCLTLLLRAAEIPAESWIEHKQAANRAIDVLGSHTLALIQAGAYIAQGYCSMEEYPIQYQQHCERLLKFSLNQAQSRYLHVYATFEASAQVLESSSKETNRDALELLHLLAILHYNNLPFELFKDAWTGAQYARDIPQKTASIDKLSKWHVSQLPQFVQVDLDKWDPYRLHRAQNLLQSLALVTKGKESGSPTVSMHSLTHTWTNIRQNQVRKRQSWRVTGCILALSYYGNSAWRPYRTHLKLHLQSFLNSDSQERDTESPTMEMIRTLFQCGQLLHELRIDSILQDLLERLFGELKGDPLEPVEEFLPLYRLASQNLYSMGKIKRTVEVLEKISRVEDATLAKDHPDRLVSQHALARAYKANGQIKDAVQLLEHVVKVEETTLDKDHPNYLVSQHALAQVYKANGRIKDAMQLLEHVVKVRETTLAEDHPDRLASQHALAQVYKANGQIKDAVQLLEHVVKVEETTLDKDHPDRLASQHALAQAYKANGQIKDAVQLLEHVVKVRETTLAKDHPDRLASQHTLARAYKANGQIKDAVQLLRHVVKVRETTLDKDHPDRLGSQHALAQAYKANGQIKNAVQLLEHVVKVEETTLDKDHPDRLASQHKLARAYKANGQIKDAVQLLGHVVKVRETTLDKDHPDRLASQHALAQAYKANGQIKNAVQLLEHIVKVREITIAEDHPRQLATQHTLAQAYKANGQIKDAVQLLEHVVKVRETTLNKDHPDRLASQHALAKAYKVNGQIKDAAKLLEHVAKVDRTTLAEDHAADQLVSQHILSRAYGANKQISSAPNNKSNVRQTKSRFHRGLRKGVRGFFQRSSITRS